MLLFYVRECESVLRVRAATLMTSAPACTSPHASSQSRGSSEVSLTNEVLVISHVADRSLGGVTVEENRSMKLNMKSGTTLAAAAALLVVGTTIPVTQAAAASDCNCVRRSCCLVPKRHVLS